MMVLVMNPKAHGPTGHSVYASSILVLAFTFFFQERGGMLKKKVLAVTKLLRVYKTLREHNEAIVQLKQLTPSHKVPFGLLRAGSGAIKKGTWFVSF